MHPLEKYLKSRNVTQSQLARKLNITPQTVANYIKGRRCPTLSIAYKIQEITRDEVTMRELHLWHKENINE
jgi:DNA-binding XRE family transcriptional regulator